MLSTLMPWISLAYLKYGEELAWKKDLHEELDKFEHIRCAQN
jgi:hypothetical protein